MPKYLKFVREADHIVVFNSSDVKLGEIYYNRASRFYQFYPMDDSSYGYKSLKELSEFIQQQNEGNIGYQ